MFLIFSIIVGLFIGLAVVVTLIMILTNALEGMVGMGAATFLMYLDGVAIFAFLLWLIVFAIRSVIGTFGG